MRWEELRWGGRGVSRVFSSCGGRPEAKIDIPGDLTYATRFPASKAEEVEANAAVASLMEDEVVVMQW